MIGQFVFLFYLSPNFKVLVIWLVLEWSFIMSDNVKEFLFSFILLV